MNNLKVKVIASLALSVLIGFAGGIASKDLFDKQNAAQANEVAAPVPVHKMTPAPIVSNQLIAPHMWSIFLDPFFMPVDLAVAPLALPDFVSLPMDVPAVKTIDGPHELQIVAQLPGLTEKDVDVQVGTDVVTIKGQKKEEKTDNKSFATVSESFVRTVQLPCKVDGDKVKATLKSGILTVCLPKREDVAATK